MAKSFTHTFTDKSWAIVTPGKSITLVSNEVDRELGIPVLKEVTFNIGDSAEYDSYNLSYFGPIKSITKKNVIVKHKHSDRTTRLPHQTFHWRNIGFNLEEAISKNAHTSMYI